MSKIIKKYSKEPWMIWLLICLSRQRLRQSWLKDVHEIIRDNDLDSSGTVPNYPEWKYYYHGIGLCLSGPNNEIIDAHFHDEEVRTIDPYFFTTRIFELSEPELPEAQLRQWLPEVELVILGIRDLQGEFLLPRESHVFRLNENHESEWDYLSQMEFSNQIVISELPLYFKGTRGESKTKEYHDNFQRWLFKQLENKKLKNSAFQAVAMHLSSEKQIEVCLKQLRKVDHKMAAAVKVLSSIDNAPSKEVIKVLRKLNAKKHHPYLAHTVCSFLLSKNLERERCISKLKAFSDRRVFDGYAGNPYDYDLAHLMLVYSPENGIILLRRALRSSTPASVQNSAVLMAAIDEDWSNKELIQVLEDKTFDTDLPNKRYIVQALVNSKDPAIRELGEANIPESRSRKENEVGYTYDEIVEYNLSESFNYYLENIQDDLGQLDIKRIRTAINNF